MNKKLIGYAHLSQSLRRLSIDHVRLMLLLPALLLAGVSQASSTYMHSGSITPTTEGWALTSLNTTCPSAPFVEGAVTNDAGSGLDAWRGCGRNLGLLGDSSCIPTQTEFEQLSCISS